jgi:hypothetical protein
LGGHATVEEIHQRAARYYEPVDLSTIYRTLDMLRDLRMVSRTDLGRGRALHEVLSNNSRHHLVCQCCEEVRDLDEVYLHRWHRSFNRISISNPFLTIWPSSAAVSTVMRKSMIRVMPGDAKRKGTMHDPDGFLSTGVSVATWVDSVGRLSYAVRRVDETLGERQVPLMGVTAALSASCRICRRCCSWPATI